MKIYEYHAHYNLTEITITELEATETPRCYFINHKYHRQRIICDELDTLKSNTMYSLTNDAATIDFFKQLIIDREKKDITRYEKNIQQCKRNVYEITKASIKGGSKQ